MRVYEKEKLIKILCNQCGRPLQLVNGQIREGVCTVETSWGYFSEKDGEDHQFDLCEKCYDEWIQKFKIPVKSRERTELV